MSTLEPPAHEPTPPEPAGEPTPPEATKQGGHSPWLWVAIGLAVVAAGLLVGAIATRSDLNDTQAELDKSTAAQTTAVAGFKKAYDEITRGAGRHSGVARRGRAGGHGRLGCRRPGAKGR